MPSDEESHRQLIEIYATLGRYHEAEQQLLLCRTVLARDLGLKPSAATIDQSVWRERRLAGQQTNGSGQRHGEHRRHNARRRAALRASQIAGTADWPRNNDCTAGGAVVRG